MNCEKNEKNEKNEKKINRIEAICKCSFGIIDSCHLKLKTLHSARVAQWVQKLQPAQRKE